MNRRQKLVQQQFLNDEEAVIKRLKAIYEEALNEINKKIAELDSSIAMLQKALNDINGEDIGDLAKAVLKGKNYTSQQAQETIRSMLQSKVYQKKYQAALQKQVSDILDKMQAKEYKAVADYLNECYENGFVGTLYDLQGQEIPLCFPLDQEQMVRAVQLDSKISQGLYSRLGEDVSQLKKKIAANISRGISTGMSYQQIARQLAGVSNIGFNNAVRIARTEGHRIQCQAGMDACYKAKDRGADVVKKWDATLDGATRESHIAVDGEIRELDKPFSNGLMFPGDPSGGAAEVVNCRCALLQRARWALDEAELDTLKERAAFFGLDKTKNFEDYKQKYLKAASGINQDHSVQNKFGQTILFDDKFNDEKWHDSVQSIKTLAEEYDTRLIEVKVGGGKSAGTAFDTTGIVTLRSTKLETAYHEFAHTIAAERLTKLGIADDSEFWKEIRKVRTQYRKEVGADPTRWISWYADSENKIDEFMAEAFTHAKMHQLGLLLPSQYGTDFTYSNEVLKTVDKYFKKPLTKSSNRAKISVQFFASKEKQFGKKVGKHAKDYGLNPSKAEDRAIFQSIINDIKENSEEVRTGYWRGQPEDVLFYIKGEDVVITDQQGEFISILKGGINNERVKNARNK